MIGPRYGAPKWATPVDRAGPGSKHLLIVDGQSVLLTVLLTGGNRNAVTQLKPLLRRIPSVTGMASAEDARHSDIELATAERTDRYNNRHHHGETAHTPPAEHEAEHNEAIMKPQTTTTT
ncbi:hypothetical protein ACFWB2_32965 [Streptomyces virginiae]|uniref:hypothetical protein n=1 Tax=Streptomyces virginiae TaxID=1961 RepID=UPI0036CBEDCC